MKKEQFTLRCFYILIIALTYFSNVNAQPFGGFIRFDGIDDELSASATLIFQNNADFTIEFWFRTCQDSLSHHQTCLGNGNNIEINMFPGSDNTFHQLCANSSSNAYVCHQDHQYPTDLEWHHLAVTYDNSQDEFEFYFDGIDGTISTSSNYDFSAGGFLYVGRSGYQTWVYEHFNGYMDELRISDTVRYNGSFTPPTNEFTADTHTRGLWHFNESISADSVPDYSGNNFHFSVSGNPQIIDLDNLVSQTYTTLTVLDTFDSYQWIDCLNDLPISGETNQSFIPTTSGYSQVEVSGNTCPLRSDCFNITVTGLDEITNNSSLTIYPNPTNNVINIARKTNHEMQIELLDNLGNLCFSGTTNKQLASIDLSNLPSGIYFVRLMTEKKIIIKKVVKH